MYSKSSKYFIKIGFYSVCEERLNGNKKVDRI